MRGAILLMLTIVAGIISATPTAGQECGQMATDQSFAEASDRACKAGDDKACISALRAERAHAVGVLSRCRGQLNDDDTHFLHSVVADIDADIADRSGTPARRQSDEAISPPVVTDRCVSASRRVDMEVTQLKIYCRSRDQCYNVHSNIFGIAEDALKECHRVYSEREEARILNIMRRSEKFMSDYNSGVAARRGGWEPGVGALPTQQFCPPGTYSNGNNCIQIAPSPPTCAGTIMAGQSCPY